MRVASSLVLGVFLGLVGAMLQTFTMRVGSVALPVGAALVLIVTTSVARACAWWAGTRWAAVAFSIGWLGATLMMGTTTPGGDLVLSSGTRQIAYLIVGTMLLSAASGFPLLPEDDEPAQALASVGTDDA
jgi:hypothetical protein